MINHGRNYQPTGQISFPLSFQWAQKFLRVNDAVWYLRGKHPGPGLCDVMRIRLLHFGLPPSRHGSVTFLHTIKVKVICIAKWLTVSRLMSGSDECLPGWRTELPMWCPLGSLPISWQSASPIKVTGSSPSHWPMWDMGVWARNKALWW